MWADFLETVHHSQGRGREEKTKEAALRPKKALCEPGDGRWREKAGPEWMSLLINELLICVGATPFL